MKKRGVIGVRSRGAASARGGGGRGGGAALRDDRLHRLARLRLLQAVDDDALAGLRARSGSTQESPSSAPSFTGRTSTMSFAPTTITVAALRRERSRRAAACAVPFGRTPASIAHAHELARAAARAAGWGTRRAARPCRSPRRCSGRGSRGARACGTRCRPRARGAPARWSSAGTCTAPAAICLRSASTSELDCEKLT